jgi:hypothetical protein
MALTRATRRNIPEDAILRVLTGLGNFKFKSYISRRVLDTRRSKRSQLKPRLRASVAEAVRLERRVAPEGRRLSVP